MLRPLKPIPLIGVGEPKGSNYFTEVPFDDEQILRQYNTAHVTPPPLAYTSPPPVLATMEPLDTFLIGDEVISTIPERENDEFIKSSVDDLVLILRESELILDSIDLKCSMPIDPPLPCTDVLGDTIVDIDLLLGEHLDTLSTGDREVDFNPSRDIEELECLLADDPVPVPRVFDEPLGNSDLVPRSYDVTFSNPLFDFNDDYTLCYDNLLFDEEFEDINIPSGESKGLEDEGPGSEDEGPGSEDEGPGSKEDEKEAASEGQQQAVPVVDTAADEPLGLGYGTLRRCELAFGEGSVPSTFDIGQSSRSVSGQQRVDETPTPTIPVRTTWIDPVDGIAYLHIEIDPRSRTPIQTPPSLEWSSGSLLVSPSSPVVPTLVASPVTTPTTTIAVGKD
ncbi:hypothetical protein Tco_0776621 [Tanacetum coccineum]